LKLTREKRYCLFPLITFVLAVSVVVLYVTYVKTEVLIIGFDGEDIIIEEFKDVNITLSYKHSVELVEVVEVYEIRDGKICVKELKWPPYGAGAPSSIKDLEVLGRQVEIVNGALIVKDLKLCLGRELRIGMSQMIEPRLLINNVEVAGRFKEVVIKLSQENVLSTLIRSLLKLNQIFKTALNIVLGGLFG